jgi:hypothetical protein
MISRPVRSTAGTAVWHTPRVDPLGTRIERPVGPNVGGAR